MLAVVVVVVTKLDLAAQVVEMVVMVQPHRLQLHQI
jgi:hypothetical protein